MSTLENKKQCGETVGVRSPVTWFGEQSLENMTPCGEWRRWPPSPRNHIYRPTCYVKPLKCDSLTGCSTTRQKPNAFSECAHISLAVLVSLSSWFFCFCVGGDRKTPLLTLIWAKEIRRCHFAWGFASHKLITRSEHGLWNGQEDRPSQNPHQRCWCAAGSVCVRDAVGYICPELFSWNVRVRKWLL